MQTACFTIAALLVITEQESPFVTFTAIPWEILPLEAIGGHSTFLERSDNRPYLSMTIAVCDIFTCQHLARLHRLDMLLPIFIGEKGITTQRDPPNRKQAIHIK